MMLEFFIDMIPPTATHQERGCVIENGRRKYYNRGNGDAEQKLTAYLSQYRPAEPFTGALQVVCKWCFPINSQFCSENTAVSDSKLRISQRESEWNERQRGGAPPARRHKDGEPYTNKPDADNLCKALYDIMTRLGYWKDDSHIYSSITEKFWAARPGLYIRIEEVEQ